MNPTRKPRTHPSLSPARKATARRPAMRALRKRGFTLVEVAISLVLLSLATVGVFSVLKQQIEQHRIADTNATLQKARDALLAYVTANGRLPCPAQPGTRGVESTI